MNKAITRIIALAMAVVIILPSFACVRENNPTPDSFYITFNVMGGDEIAKKKYDAGADIGTLPTPNHENPLMVFEGWFTDETLTQSVPSKITSDLTLYAKWTLYSVVYNVTLDINGGTALEQDTIRVGAGEKLLYSSLPNPARSGYNFLGWFTSSDQAVTADLTITSNITLLAKWEAIWVMVSYHYTDGKDIISDPDDVVGDDIYHRDYVIQYSTATQPAAPTDRRRVVVDGLNTTTYDFLGWSTNKDANTVQDPEIFSFTTAVEGNLNLYAVWGKPSFYKYFRILDWDNYALYTKIRQFDTSYQEADQDNFFKIDDANTIKSKMVMTDIDEYSGLQREEDGQAVGGLVSVESIADTKLLESDTVVTYRVSYSYPQISTLQGNVTPVLPPLVETSNDLNFAFVTATSGNYLIKMSDSVKSPRFIDTQYFFRAGWTGTTAYPSYPHLALPATYNGKIVEGIADSGAARGAGAFAGLTGESVTLPSTYKKIGSHAFEFSLVKAIYGLEYAQTIGYEAFIYSVYIEEIRLDNVVTISSASFAGCASLKNLYIGKNAVFSYNDMYPDYAVDEFIFEFFGDFKRGALLEGDTAETASFDRLDPTAVTDDVLARITQRGHAARLESIDVHAENPRYSSENGILYNKNKTILLFVPSANTGNVANNTFEIPESVVAISSFAMFKPKEIDVVRAADGANLTTVGSCFVFNRRESITIDLSKATSLTTIDTMLISSGGTKLSYLINEDTKVGYGIIHLSVVELTLPSSVTKIDKFGLSALAGSIYGGENVEYVGDYAFKGHYDLEFDITYIEHFPKLEYIGIGAYQNYQGDSFSVSSTVEFIGNSAFQLSKIESFYNYSRHITAFPESMFWYASDLDTVIDYAGTIVAVEDYAFGGAESLQSLYNATLSESGWRHSDAPASAPLANSGVVYLAGYTKVGEEAFYDCIHISKVVWGSGINASNGKSYMRSGTFANNFVLSAIYLPDNLVSIDAFAFSYAYNLTTIQLPSQLESIMSFAFTGSGLVEITLPKSFKRLDSGAFFDCHDLERVTIESVEYIGMFAFNNTYKLNYLELPANLRNIQYCAFAYTYLKFVVFNAGIERVGFDIFAFNYTLKAIFWRGAVPTANLDATSEIGTSITEDEWAGELGLNTLATRIYVENQYLSGYTSQDKNNLGFRKLENRYIGVASLSTSEIQALMVQVDLEIEDPENPVLGSICDDINDLVSNFTLTADTAGLKYTSNPQGSPLHQSSIVAMGIIIRIDTELNDVEREKLAETNEYKKLMQLFKNISYNLNPTSGVVNQVKNWYNYALYGFDPANMPAEKDELPEWFLLEWAKVDTRVQDYLNLSSGN